MIEPRAAPVRPRVLLPGATGAVLLEDEVAERLEAGECGFIEIAGPPGSGKSTAIRHLAHLFGEDSRLRLADASDSAEILKLFKASTKQLVVCTTPAATSRSNSERWRLTPWTSDEWIEYLLAMHRDRCASVMQRIQADPERRSLAGVPELWSVVLDCLAMDESLPNVAAALGKIAVTSQSPKLDFALASEFCLACLLVGESSAIELLKPIDVLGTSAVPLLRLLRHQRVQLLLGAERLFANLQINSLLLKQRLPESLVRETAPLVRNHEPTIRALQKVLTGSERDRHAMAASLLHAAGVNWIPARGKAPLLAGAYLSGVQWPKIRLRRLNVLNADLTGADLSEAYLEEAVLHNAKMSDVRLHGASLNQVSAKRAILSGADLSFVRASAADFYAAELRHANFEGALLRSAKFNQANLCGARFCRADLKWADLGDCQIEEADFSQATLSSAKLSGLDLRQADFTGATFTRATLRFCSLEYMSLPGANFDEAILEDAQLTGSQIPNGRFRGANLAKTRLAEIDWPRADLRDADLRGATFHLGSTRSGLVGSPIASEGSRTGFYTDELTEQDFKAPEEIRKANLCGADLRGAKIDNVDFYLVDLRNAHYTNDQEMHFRRCGAILETRV